MIEIAIAIGVIAFALVAIIGVLPFGLNVQKETHQDTIISQDGPFLLEAIRNGGVAGPSPGNTSLDFLTNYIEQINGSNAPNSGKGILGLLSTPKTVTTVRMRSLSGSALEQNGANSVVAFRYYMYAQIVPFGSSTEIASNAYLPNSLYEISLKFSWPVLANGGAGPGRAHFRTLVSGQLVTNTGFGGWLMEPNSYSTNLTF
jgi:hypothetical protein